jgi:hypothetical protein
MRILYWIVNVVKNKSKFAHSEKEDLNMSFLESMFNLVVDWTSDCVDQQFEALDKWEKEGRITRAQKEDLIREHGLREKRADLKARKENR